MQPDEEFNQKFAFRGLGPLLVHVAKSTTDDFPSAWVRIIFDDEAQRDEFLNGLEETAESGDTPVIESLSDEWPHGESEDLDAGRPDVREADHGDRREDRASGC